jgi:hypothetical protein
MKVINKEDILRIIEMAWEDRTPFEAIEFQFGLKENDIREIMRNERKSSSFKGLLHNSACKLNQLIQ